MINETLSIDTIKKKSSLTKFWVATTKKNTALNDSLIDIGAASGRFLFHIKDYFKKTLGIEVSPASLQFATESMHLPVKNQLNAEDCKNISCVTAWHTLEHIPVEAINETFQKIRKYSTKNARVIISVPNGSSIWGYFFMKYFSFYDVHEHLHQFSFYSLQLLLKQSNLSIIKVIPALPYSGFNALQSLLNLFLSPHNFLYYFLKRSAHPCGASASKVKALFHILLAGCLMPLALPFIIFELILPRYAAALTVVCSFDHD